MPNFDNSLTIDEVKANYSLLNADPKSFFTEKNDLSFTIGNYHYPYRENPKKNNHPTFNCVDKVCTSLVVNEVQNKN